MTTKYEVTFALDTADVQTLVSEGKNLVFAMDMPAPGANMIWLVVPPMQANTLMWDGDSIGVFATAGPGIPGQAPVILAKTPASVPDQTLTTLTPTSVTVTTPDPSLAEGAYGAVNSVPASAVPVVSMGLTLVSGSNAAPLNIAPAATGTALTFGPISGIQVWIDDTSVAGTNIAALPTTGVTTVPLTPLTATQTWAYDSAAGEFKQVVAAQEIAEIQAAAEKGGSHCVVRLSD